MLIMYIHPMSSGMNFGERSLFAVSSNKISDLLRYAHQYVGNTRAFEILRSFHETDVVSPEPHWGNHNEICRATSDISLSIAWRTDDPSKPFRDCLLIDPKAKHFALCDPALDER